MSIPFKDGQFPLTTCNCNKGWDFLMEPDDTAGIIICRKCKEMYCVDITDLAEFNRLFPDAKILKDPPENSGFLNKDHEREIWLQIITNVIGQTIVEHKPVSEIIKELMIKYKLFLNN